MIKKNNAIYLCLITTFSTLGVSNTYLTYDFSGGRFGDNLVSYIRCKILSYTHNIPMLYNPFQYSDKLALSMSHTRLTHQIKQKLKHKAIKNNTNELTKPQNNTLYKTKYMPELTIREKLIEFCWKNNDFLIKIRNLIKPLKPINRDSIPNDRISIAIHIRKGSEGDHPLYSERTCKKFNKKGFPFKFPPEQYYIDQIQLLSKLLDSAKLYIRIFTDDKKPKQLVDRLKQTIHKDSIIFDCKTNKNHSSDVLSILQDFFDMGQFDILIRPDSNFSLCAQIVGNNVISIRPDKHHWKGDHLIIDESIAMVRTGNQVSEYSLPSQKDSLREKLIHLKGN